MNRVLVVAYHYPPMRGSSGIQRTLKFSQYLPQHGWQPLVLSAHPRAYANSGPDQLDEIPREAIVHRAFALDTSRHLSLRGRYVGWMALPDRWVSWCLGAIPAGLRMIRNYKPQVIWTTYPIASAKLIGLALHRLTGLPWIADLRDPMTDVDYPADPLTRRLYRWIEEQTIRHCTLAVCTTPGAIVTYTKRFPDIPVSRFALIENGYDEENFANAAALQKVATPGPFTLIHSGIVYPSERDPGPFFEALADLKRDGSVTAERLRVVLRATAHDDFLRPLIERHGIADIVTLAPHIAYRDALAEMLGADGLLVLQATNCNHQIPAKLYEYLRARRPVLALTDATGDTAAALRHAGIDTIGPLDDKAGIKDALLRFLALAEAGHAPLASDEAVAANSRRARTAELARLLDQVTVTVPNAQVKGTSEAC
ncbi:glycosyl transferase family 4 [Pseudoduganella flava]|uniref:Glycosyl transferase family 4 n=1 Tax=Pseudoduganella flava TaxID=871742 RepID=A0A562PNH1_9BURK|nr:glycosyltransferase [Pseudoduganella flava]QGZ40566.1 glycosyltransferase [Pseudoduganella flava]TWI46012.1 glycosyl transferase family 4 [Pseudoduganella flava]